MAKTKVSKTQRIRDFFKEKPDATNAQALAALSKQGITMNSIYAIRGEMKGKRPRSVAGKRRGPAGPKVSAKSQTAREHGPIIVDELDAAKRFVVEEFGGNADRAEKAVERLRAFQLQ